MNPLILLERFGKLLKDIGIRLLEKSTHSLRDRNKINLMISATFIAASIVAFSPYLTDSNTYFWTYSTLIQAFAAMIALVAMFLIYALERLKQERQTLLRELKNDSILIHQVLRGLALRQYISDTREAYKASEEEAQLYRKDLDFFTEEDILKEAMVKSREVLSKLEDGELNSSSGPGLRYISNKIDDNLIKIRLGESYADSLIKTIKSPLVLVGLIIGLSLLLLPWSSAVTNYYLKIPLSFLLVVVLGLSIIATFRIITAIRKILEMTSGK